MPGSDDTSHARQDGGLNSPEGLSLEAIQQQLERILSSAAFSHSERLRRFLRYVVEAVNQGRGEFLKEYQVGTAVFDRHDSFDTRLDPIVRVEARRLRAKLEEYYSAEGRDDTVQIELPKGSYAPVFQKRSAAELSALEPAVPATSWRRSQILALVLAMIGFAVAGSWAWLLRGENRALKHRLDSAPAQSTGAEFEPFWHPIFSATAENFIVFGSPIFFSAENQRLFLRLVDINSALNLLSDRNFQALRDRFGSLSGPRFDYALMGDALALHRLSYFLGQAGARVAALPAHVATWDVIKEGNVIFLGPPRMDPLLQNLPVRQDFIWQGDVLVNQNPRAGEQARYESPSHYDKVTYALVSSLPGLQRNRRLLMLTTHSAPGTLAAVDYVTRPQSLKEMNEKLGLGADSQGKNYQLVLRVYVDKGNFVRSEYLTHHFFPVQQP